MHLQRGPLQRGPLQRDSLQRGPLQRDSVQRTPLQLVAFQRAYFQPVVHLYEMNRPKFIYSHPSLIRTHVNPAGQTFLVPEPVHNPFSCILYFLNRNPELVKAGHTCMLFGSQLTKIRLVLLCYIGK